MAQPSIAELRRRLDGLTIRDAARLGRRLKNLRGAKPEKLRQLFDQITAAEALVATRDGCRAAECNEVRHPAVGAMRRRCPAIC